MNVILHIRSRRKGKSDRETESTQQEGKFFKMIMIRTTETGNQYSNNAIQRCVDNAINRVQGFTG